MCIHDTTFLVRYMTSFRNLFLLVTPISYLHKINDSMVFTFPPAFFRCDVLFLHGSTKVFVKLLQVHKVNF